jgi:AraC family transcriptional regulator
MDVRIVELAPKEVACLRHTGPFGPQLADFWRNEVGPWLERHHLKGRVTYGVAQDDPGSTPAEQCRYDACVEVGAEEPPAQPGFLATIPGGRYAAADYHGTGEGIGQAWMAFYSEALPAAGLASRPGPCFERYGADYREDPETGAFDCELLIPIA